MDRQTAIVLLGFGIVAAACATACTRRMDHPQNRASLSGYHPHPNTGCFLVKIIKGPSWCIGDYGTYDAEANSLQIDGQEYRADEFEFTLA